MVWQSSLQAHLQNALGPAHSRYVSSPYLVKVPAGIVLSFSRNDLSQIAGYNACRKSDNLTLAYVCP